MVRNLRLLTPSTVGLLLQKGTWKDSAERLVWPAFSSSIWDISVFFNPEIVFMVKCHHYVYE